MRAIQCHSSRATTLLPLSLSRCHFHGAFALKVDRADSSESSSSNGQDEHSITNVRFRGGFPIFTRDGTHFRIDLLHAINHLNTFPWSTTINHLNTSMVYYNEHFHGLLQ
jgi:hypothetical protein